MNTIPFQGSDNLVFDLDVEYDDDLNIIVVCQSCQHVAITYRTEIVEDLFGVYTQYVLDDEFSGARISQAEQLCSACASEIDTDITQIEREKAYAWIQM